MNKELRNRVALITGSSRGIGKEIAVTLAKAGADVVICGSSKVNVEKAEKELGSSGTKTYSYVLDATKSAEVKNLFSNIIQKIGQLDILVNNVGGIKESVKFLDVTDEQWQAAWNLNFMTMVNFSREAIPWLKKSLYGRIINISSVPGKQPGMFNPHYGAPKAAMNYLNKYLANSLAPDGILVNAILPHTVLGGLWDEHVADRAKKLNVSAEEAGEIMKKEIKERIPLGKMAMLEDVAELVAFLASDKAKFITGTSIAVDGGTIKSIF
ncbi:MAG: SDR family NAD(P)-dependent oxidoreductase [Candidatus Paceibacterota bacterium]|jgi:NAD(P)-dependent dehydrogenase (short-subunit alcohol dehydrogenase family)